ncbi:hypothetical protein AWC05_19685 [Mycobacterium florentinum]|uniref:Membrane protein ArfC n=1 Tax=Mycobacterium florentinum TaxID=292462 RepID=A0A1X1UA17_MYCFL|nr:hypothetical protein [Mycobacterium florentinum]MCV7411325.1 hypothetical protein [Mycobacterium florentinum]ORV53646.1 hypothetical protein AWC05_19685 [Mycobacterium florentinum]BBX80680.1 putative membrane protein ArfC [Mycobacterium florentinum]
MNHVHWWLFGLSFAMGLVLTLAFLTRSVKYEVPLDVSADHPVIPDPPTTRIVTEVPTTRVATDPPTAKIPANIESRTTKIPVPPPAPYGPGSVRAGPDGRGPAGWLVKARIDTRLYYIPDNPGYDPTVAQVWFSDEQSALRAGFTPWHPNARK